MSLEKTILQSKKDRAFYRVIKKWLLGTEVNEVELAVELSSMLTHSLIEVKQKGLMSPDVSLRVAIDVDIVYQSDAINRFICGEVTAEELRQEYLVRYGEAFDIE
jgi:DNA-binding transcriptional regulator YdaS (Cro superfamily)